MADAIFSSLHLNQIQGNYVGPPHHKGFATGENDQVVSAAEGKQQDHPNTKHPWLTSDQDDRRRPQDLPLSLHPISEHMSGSKDPICGGGSQQRPPPLTCAPAATTSSGLQWLQNDAHLQHNRLQQPMYDATPAAAYSGGDNYKHGDDITLQPQLVPETIGKPLKEKSNSLTLDSLELLASYGKGVGGKNVDPIFGINPIIRKDQVSLRGPNKLSLGEIVKVAGERYVQLSTQKDKGFAMFMHPYNTPVTDLTPEETADVELVQLLLAAAESVGHRHYDIAYLLINRCQWIASESGSGVRRIVFYFAEALQNRIDMETGRTPPERMYERATYAKRLQVDFNLSFLACHQELPFSQAIQFAAVQAILDNIGTAEKIHLVDLHIRSGIQWTVLMQALAERDQLPSVKISALATTNKQHMEETGRRLRSFAQSLNLDFTFNVVPVTEMKQLREEMFKKETDEVVAVYSALILRTMISNPDSLGHLMRIIRRLKPSIVAVTEVEANHNSPSFVSRFTESLFFYGAFFDCLDDCMERDNQHRKIIEGIYLGEGIRNIVGSEGDKRCTRNVTIDVWREFFAWYGMAEMELSESALRHANMVLKKFGKANSCNITYNGKGIVIGWKGTPIHSLTTWKFL